MTLLTTSGVVFLAALLCAAGMGLAIQRGGTCAVAAVEEVLAERRLTRLLAIVEASLWVSAGLLLAHRFGLLNALPAGYAVSGWTAGGAALLGLGAALNRACVVGTVARLGSGEWAYLATPVGFYLGCLTEQALFGLHPAQRLTQAAPVLAAPLWLAWALWAVLPALVAQRFWRVRRVRAQGLVQGLVQGLWTPHNATALIGLLFVALLLLAGAWAYTDVLADLARVMAGPLGAPGLGARAWLAGAMLAGAVAGGWLTGKWRRHPLRAQAVLRCAGGGLLMGWGGQMVPGGNDVLLLVGMPLLWPYAWVAFATMGAVVAAALGLPRWLGRGRTTMAGR